MERRESEAYEKRLNEAKGFWQKESVGNVHMNNLNISRKQAELIRNFPIPTTKEDILELLTLAVSNSKVESLTWIQKKMGMRAVDSSSILSEAWKNKAEQVIMTARFSFERDDKVLKSIELYARQLKIK